MKLSRATAGHPHPRRCTSMSATGCLVRSLPTSATIRALTSSWKARRRSASVRGGAAMTSAGTSCVRTKSSKAATDLAMLACCRKSAVGPRRGRRVNEPRRQAQSPDRPTTGICAGETGAADQCVSVGCERQTRSRCDRRAGPRSERDPVLALAEFVLAQLSGAHDARRATS